MVVADGARHRLREHREWQHVEALAEVVPVEPHELGARLCHSPHPIEHGRLRPGNAVDERLAVLAQRARKPE